MPSYRVETLSVPLRVVKLVGIGVDDHVVVRELPEVEARLIDGEVSLGAWRKVPEEEHRKPFLGHLVDRTHRDAEPVRVLQPFVDPRPVGQAAGVELACREHRLAILAVHDIPVVVDRCELVVGPDLLNLPERVQQRRVVPQPDVVDRLRVVLDVRHGERGVTRQLSLLDLVEVKRRPRGRDVVNDVGRFPCQLVRRYHQLLQQHRDSATTDQDEQVRGHRYPDRPDRGRQRRIGRGQCSAAGDDGQDLQGRKSNDGVGVRHPVDDASRCHQSSRPVEIRPGREQHEDARDQHRQVLPGFRAHLEARGRQRELAGDDVGCRRADERQGDDGQT